MVRVLLDYDGTLHDCLKIYAPAFQRAYQTLVDEGFRPPKDWRPQELAGWLGMSPKDMWAEFAPDLPEKLREQCSQIIFQEMLRRTAGGGAELYPGVPALLERLKNEGYSLILLSNCQRRYLEVHRRRFSLDRHFDGFYCTEDYGWPAKWELFPAIRREFPGEYIVVGDRSSDLEIARRHRLPSVGCAYGYGGREEMAGASVRIQRPEELERALRSIAPARRETPVPHRE